MKYALYLFVSSFALLSSLSAKPPQQLYTQIPPQSKVTITTISNAKAFDEALKITDTKKRAKTVAQIERDQKALVANLTHFGLFEFFTPEEWLAPRKDGQEGRAFVATVYLEQYPELITKQVYDVLKLRRKKCSKELGQRLKQVMKLSEYYTASASSSQDSSKFVW